MICTSRKESVSDGALRRQSSRYGKMMIPSFLRKAETTARTLEKTNDAVGSAKGSTPCTGSDQCPRRIVGHICGQGVWQYGSMCIVGRGPRTSPTVPVLGG